jgi:hypothetical protein
MVSFLVPRFDRQPFLSVVPDSLRRKKEVLEHREHWVLEGLLEEVLLGLEEEKEHSADLDRKMSSIFRRKETKKERVSDSDWVD